MRLFFIISDRFIRTVLCWVCMRKKENMVGDALRQGVRVLMYPGKCFEELNGMTLERVSSLHMILVIFAGIAAGVVSFLFTLGSTLYFDVFRNLDTNYFVVANYSFGISMGFIFLYLFVGTFGVFFVSLLLRPFFRKMKYTAFLKIVLFSVVPVLFFGWIMRIPIPFFLWSVFLFIVGIRTYRKHTVKHGSIDQRD